MYYLSSLTLSAAALTSPQETDIMKEIMDKGPVQGMANLEDGNMHNVQCLLSKY